MDPTELIELLLADRNAFQRQIRALQASIRTTETGIEHQITKLMSEGDLSYSDAASAVAAQDPDLYERYRQTTYANDRRSSDSTS